MRRNPGAYGGQKWRPFLKLLVWRETWAQRVGPAFLQHIPEGFEVCHLDWITLHIIAFPVCFWLGPATETFFCEIWKAEAKWRPYWFLCREVEHGHCCVTHTAVCCRPLWPGSTWLCGYAPFPWFPPSILSAPGPGVCLAVWWKTQVSSVRHHIIEVAPVRTDPGPSRSSSVAAWSCSFPLNTCLPSSSYLPCGLQGHSPLKSAQRAQPSDTKIDPIHDMR